ncbi:MAG TPA: 1-deoxy-D-xylulose-5-phosphate reductoisomerase [archaeon]|nr:1-deoxy-D-xylulose-5-phosphate reductoisomerase [archaeon]
MSKAVCILGATGSIGRNCLAVIARLGSLFTVTAVAARTNAELLVEAARSCGASRISLADCASLDKVAGDRLKGLEVGCGQEAIVELAGLDEVDIVVNALVGAAGLAPSVAALKAGKRLALANKESLVMAGAYLMRLAAEREGAEIIPIDSEHSALFQLIRSQPAKSLKKVIITASGGPFRGCGQERLQKVTFSESLNHPTWSMGPKITVDSATLANKGLEVIEAHFLFGLGYEHIEVLVHPQSIVHGMAVFNDGSVLGHMGVPDMRIPIQYALTYPERLPNDIKAPDFNSLGKLTFEAVDEKNFPCLSLAYEAGRRGGAATAVYNAANESAVEDFSKGRIGFTQIPVIIERTLAAAPQVENPSLGEIMEADNWAREFAKGLKI